MRPCFKSKTNPPKYFYNLYFIFLSTKVMRPGSLGPCSLPLCCTLPPCSQHCPRINVSVFEAKPHRLQAANQRAAGAGAFLGLFPEVRACYVTLPALTSRRSSCLSLLTAWIRHATMFGLGTGTFKCLPVCGHVWRPEADTGNLSTAPQLVSEAGSPRTLNSVPC